MSILTSLKLMIIFQNNRLGDDLSLGDFFRTCTSWFLEREVDVNIYQSFRTHTWCQSFRIIVDVNLLESLLGVSLLEV